MAPEQDDHPTITWHEENIAEMCRHLQQADNRESSGNASHASFSVIHQRISRR